MDLTPYFEDYEGAASAYVEAKNLYRNEKAKFIMELLDPAEKPDGWKKPTEKFIDASVDANLKLQQLRMDRDKKEITAISCRLALEAVVNDIKSERSNTNADE